MTGKVPASGKASHLRRRAAEKLLADQSKQNASSPEQMQRLLHELEVHQIELEMQNEELLRAHAELETSRARYFDLYDLAPVCYLTLGPGDTIQELNLAAAKLFGLKRAEVIQQSLSRFIMACDQTLFRQQLKMVLGTRQTQTYQYRLQRPDGKVLWIRMSTSFGQGAAGEEVVHAILMDITEQRQADDQERLAKDVLAALNKSNNTSNVVLDILRLIKERTGIEAVGIRLKEASHFPLFQSLGFPDEFLRSDNHFCCDEAAGRRVHDEQGQLVMSCMCEQILQKQVDVSQPCFTVSGSFWSNSISDLAATVPAVRDKLFTRSCCRCAGYETLGLIPLRSGEAIIGLLQLNDHRRNQLSQGLITFLEGLGASVGIAFTRMREAEQLRVSEQKFQTLFEGSRDAILILSPPEWQFVSGNPAAVRMFGFRNEAELLAHGPGDLSPERQPDGCLSIDRVREMNALVLREGSHFFEWQHRRPNGEEFPADIHLTRIVIGGELRLQATVRDITARKLAEVAQARLAMAVEQADEVIVITDANATILYANPSFERVTGFKRAEVIGQNPRILKSGKHPIEFYRQIWATLTAGRVWRGRFINKRKDGTLYQEDATISPVLDAAGKVINYVASKRDVSHEAALEERNRQAVKMEAVGRLAGGVAHDFNNMLQVIIYGTGMVLKKLPVKHGARVDLLDVMDAAQRSAALTRQLLAFSRKQSIMPKVLDVNETISNSLQLLSRLIGENIRLSYAMPQKLWPIFMDANQFDQILANLMVNARDAIAGNGHIIIGAMNRTLLDTDCRDQPDFIPPGDYVMVTLRDDGAGMTPEVQAHLFEPFFTTKGMGKGTGMGLATVYGIVKQNHGAITVESAPGRGTMFSIFLPRTQQQAAPVVREAEVLGELDGTETILLVEDETAVLNMTRQMLESRGYKVIAATGPASALQYCEQSRDPIHLLLTDVIMPDMSGKVLADRIRKLRPSIRVLYMSGYPADIMEQHGHIPAGVEVLTKPFTDTKMLQRVRHHLDASE